MALFELSFTVPLTVMPLVAALAQMAPAVRNKEKRTSSIPITFIFILLITTSLPY
jgi:hypothetical protein